eukprot:97191-Amphidinium_carterae.2
MSADVIHRRPKEEMEEEEEDEDMASVLSTDTIESKASDRSVGSVLRLVDVKQSRLPKGS